MWTAHHKHHATEGARTTARGNGVTTEDVDRHFGERRAQTMWTYFANIALGIWLLTTPAMFDYQEQVLAWSDAVSGALVAVLGVLALYPRGDVWGRWGICCLGIWLWLAPLIFHVPTAFVYANDTIVGVLLVSFSVLLPGVPGKAHLRVEMQLGPEVPPGWSYNPSSWGQRGPIIVLAFISFLIARYMAAFQLGHIDSVWDPFFRPGTTKVLTSDVSKSFPVSDAGLGAVSYLMEGLSGFLGGTSRWRTTPWMVVLFGIMIVPLGVVSIALVVMQPVVVGAWCAPCLLTALFMLVMIPMALDEVWATAQFLLRARREGRSLWKTFWVGGTIVDGTVEEPTPRREMPDWNRLLAGLFHIKVPWTLIASALIGFWLMAAPPLLGSRGPAASSDFLVGPLIAVVAATAMAEVGRPARLLNVALGLWLTGAPWLLSGATIGSTISDIIAGMVLIALSVPQGEVRDQYDGWQPYIR